MDAGQPSAHDALVRLANALAAAMEGDTQTRVAAVTGIDQGRLSRIMRFERNESPTLDELARIEDARGLPRGYILTLAGFVSVEGARAGERAAKAAARTRTGRS